MGPPVGYVTGRPLRFTLLWYGLWGIKWCASGYIPCLFSCFTGNPMVCPTVTHEVSHEVSHDVPHDPLREQILPHEISHAASHGTKPGMAHNMG